MNWETKWNSKLQTFYQNWEKSQFKNISHLLILNIVLFQILSEFLSREIIIKTNEFSNESKLYIELLNKTEDNEYLASALFLIISLWSWNICYLWMNGDLCLCLRSEINFSEALLLIIVILNTKYLEVLMNKYFDSFPLLNQ